MKKSLNKWIIPLTALTLIVGIIIGIVVQEARLASAINMADLESIIAAYKLAKDNAIEDFDDQTLVTGLLNGLAGTLQDDYAYYFSKEELSSYNDDKNGIIRGGIGVTIMATQQGVIITEVYPDSPAEKVGIKVGDVFLEVQDRDVTNISQQELSELVGGEEGTTVKIRVKRGENELVFEPVRAYVVKPMVTYTQMRDITYIKYTSFNGNAVEKFNEALKSAQDNSSKGIIIDLRDNLGGSLDILAETADKILPEGDIIYALDKQGSRMMERKSDQAHLDIPIVILTNAYSASASEAFAGAARDHGVATIVGTKTYGKGIMQTTYNLPNGGAFKLTVAKYYLPKGDCIHKEGIAPDYVVKLPGDLESRPYNMTDEQDTQLQKALELLRK